MTEQTFAWQDGPFQLISTPLGQGMKFDTFVKAGTMMALVHNGFMRAFNCIYHVAPHVPVEDYKNFLEYSHQVYQTLHTHHEEEEQFIFPLIEEKAEIKGLMETNVKQHASFERGLEDFRVYIRSLLDDDINNFSAEKIRQLIMAVKDALQLHLTEEIDTLLKLKETKLTESEFANIVETSHQKALKAYTLTRSVPVLMLNHDMTYEGGIHGMFPPMPAPVSFMVRRMASCWHWGWWKYAACDAGQRPKALPYP